MLNEERDFYEKHLADWLSQHPGRFVLIKGSELVGTFDTIEAALAEGARRFGLNSFLVRRIEPADGRVYIPALALGLLYADPAQPVHGAGASA